MQLIATNDAAKSVLNSLEKVMATAPAAVDKDALAENIIMAANSVGHECTPRSVVMACYHAAKIGLQLNTPMGLAYLIPYKRQCTLVIGYQGYLELAYSNNFLKQVYAEVVYGGDDFQYWVDETGPRLMHRPEIFERDVTTKTCRANCVGAYCVWTTNTGGHGIRLINRSQIDIVDSRKHVWASEYYEMVRKTAIRRAAKDWRKTPRLAAAVAIDEQFNLDSQGGGSIPMEGANISLEDLMHGPQAGEAESQGSENASTSDV